MSSFSDFWRGLGTRGRAGFAAGIVLIAAIMIAIATWTLRPTYGVLFSGLNESDLAAMAGELDKMKIGYRVSDEGGQLLVPEALVHKTRLALMDRDVPLHGAVGFELFNNVEFGTSEFVQKINYQRALQGELTRTILAIDEVKSARVHLAIPEQGLFRKDTQKSTASVSIATKPGRPLSAQQVQGIQRLVAASVPEVQAADVTVLDQHGVPLSRAASADADGMEATGAAALDLKASTEKYLTQKATEVLDRSFGKGVAVVSVDAVFVQQQTRVTTEEVLPAKGGEPGQAAAGVVVRERQTLRDPDSGASQNGPQVTNSETEYQVGHRTEQVSVPAGDIKRLDVAVVVRKDLSEADLQRVRDIVCATIGINRERGDIVAVEPLGTASADVAPPTASIDSEAPARTAVAATGSAGRTADTRAAFAVAALLLAVAGAVAAMLWMSRRRAADAPGRLTESEREQLLRTVQDWLVNGTPPSAP